MKLRIAREGWPFIIGLPLFCVVIGVLSKFFVSQALACAFYALALIFCAFMVYFFRDPERIPPSDTNVVVSGADGVVRCVEKLDDLKYLGVPAIRISVFLNPFNVHINRAPIGGVVTQLGYEPGKHLLTMNNAASEHNEHSRILIRGERISCRVHQIVGPVVRRVIYWLQQDQTLSKGDRIGLMKFGSRLDVYLPAESVSVLVQVGDKVQAGLTPIATISKQVSS